MTDLERLSAVSRILGWVCLALMIFLPLWVVAGWLSFDTWGSTMASRLGIARDYAVPETLSAEQVMLGITVTMAPVSTMIFGLWNLRKLLAGFGAGRIFTLENTRALKIFAWSVLMVIVVQFLTDGLLSMVLTLNNPPGQRVLALGLSSDQVVAFFFGAVFVLIARVLEEGRKLADENASIL
ncbi:MAG: DUF2975 domain-containing protein [Rhodospirillaceae bacterium]|nr:DUF2975 domain-containing protein [Rhodospirillaceae bacterium]